MSAFCQGVESYAPSVCVVELNIFRYVVGGFDRHSNSHHLLEIRIAPGVIMTANRAISWSIGGLLASLVLVMPVQAAVEDNAILALEPQQGTVVVKTAAGTLEVISVGDAFPDSEVIVKQVLADKVVAEEMIGEDDPVIQTLWVYKAKNPDAGSRVERMLLHLPEYGTLVPVRIDQLGGDASAISRETVQ